MEITINKLNKPKSILLVFLIVAVALLFRRFDAFVNPQLWAEDYVIYFFQTEQYGIRSLLMPYGGYLHFFPRLISLFWSALHVNYLYIPICYSVSEFLATFLIALNIWNTSACLGIKHRILYATSFLLLPVASDIFMNLTNINWIASLFLVNFLFTRHSDYSNKIFYLNLVFIFIISLSGPFSTLLSPLVIAVLILERKELSFKKVIPLCLILLGGIIQFIYIKFIDTSYQRTITGLPEHHHLIRLVTNNMSVFLMLKYIMQWVSPFAIQIISFFAFLALLFIFIARYLKIDNKRRYILLWYGIIVFLSFIQAYWPFESKIVAVFNARYYFIPFVCAGWLMILSFDKIMKPWHVGLYVALLLIQYRHIRMVLPDKQWKRQILEYYDGKRQTIDINPEGWNCPLPERK
ncbi:MAG: hypothetical protein ACLQQ4_06845 [Bacteroidia bacterium]